MRTGSDIWQVIHGFQEAMAKHGLHPKKITPDGKIHRFAPNGRGDEDAWYVLYEFGGAFGDWSQDLKETYTPLNGSTTPQEHAAIRVAIKQARQDREQDEAQRHLRTAQDAEALWGDALDGGTTPYLERKQVITEGVRIDGQDVLVPLRDITGKLWSLQRIMPDGQKRFLAGGKKKGLFCLIGDLQRQPLAYVAEGYATAMTLRMATDRPVVVAFDAGNIDPVVEALRKACPKTAIIIAGDDDKWKPEKGNAGRAKAVEAARKHGCKALFPIFRDEKTHPTDFNDLQILEGLDVVRRQVADKVPESVISRANPLNWNGIMPKREWIVEDWLPHRYVTALYADGGVGKSLISQQLATAVVTGRPWLGMPTQRGRVYGLFCEDSEDDLGRRQQDINEMYGLTMHDIAEDFAIVSRVGRDNYLMTFDRGDKAQYSDFFRSLYQDIRDFRPSLVILDTAADLFGGNENNRTQVRHFIQSGLGRIARDANCAVLLCAHPSAAGLATKSGSGGSTAWNNTLRSRWYLTRPKFVEEETGEASDERTLKRMKSNYARAGVELRITYQDGAFVPVVPETLDTVGRIARNVERKKFIEELDKLIAEGFFPSDSPNSTHYTPRLLAFRMGQPENTLRDIMRVLMAQGEVVHAYGQDAHRNRKRLIARKDHPLLTGKYLNTKGQNNNEDGATETA